MQQTKKLTSVNVNVVSNTCYSFYLVRCDPPTQVHLSLAANCFPRKNGGMFGLDKRVTLNVKTIVCHNWILPLKQSIRSLFLVSSLSDIDPGNSFDTKMEELLHHLNSARPSIQDGLSHTYIERVTVQLCSLLPVSLLKRVKCAGYSLYVKLHHSPHAGLTSTSCGFSISPS